MHVISEKALRDFWRQHPEALAPLKTWLRTMQQGTFTTFAELKGTFNSVDLVAPGQVVFNVGGNNLRLAVAIHFNREKVYIRRVMTHAEYTRRSKDGTLF